MTGASFRRAGDIGVRRVGGEIFILAPDGDLVVLGNETAVCLWEAVEDGASTVTELVEALTATYEVSPAQASLDARSFVRTLMERTVLLAIAK
jgi:hypothetical protein